MITPINVHRPTSFSDTLLGRRGLIAFTLVMTYGAGFWLWMLHEVEGAVEPNEPIGVIHWLRDSSLSLPLVAAGVYIGSLMARNLLQRYGRDISPAMAAAVVAAVLATYASVALSVGNPIHGWLFAGAVHGGGHDLPFAVHVVRDGLLAVTANLTLAAALATILLAQRWIISKRPAAAVQPA